MSNEIKSILNWFEQAKPEPTTEDACVQIGCHYEEIGEMAVVTGDVDVKQDCEIVAAHYKLKNKNYISDLELLEQSGVDKIELLDALCDQIVTAIGVAHMLKMDINGALSEVNRSNWSKFEDGKPVFDENGKIKKGKDYFTPNLEEFIK